MSAQQAGNRNRKRRKTGNRSTGRQQRQQTVLKMIILCMAFVAVVLFSVIFKLYQNRKAQEKAQDLAQNTEVSNEKVPRPELDVELLTVNEYSRPAIALKKVDGIVIHYTANPGTSAIANRNYFEGLKDSHVTKASSHFVIGLEGEVVQCIPSSEIAYASNDRNYDTISIECCIEDESGKFNEATYDSAVHVTAWLVEHFGLETEDVIRHFDVTGKECPKYFVDYPSAWDQFLLDVQAYLEKYQAV